MKQQLMDVLQSYGIVCHVDEPTRETATASTGLDYVCSNLMNDDISCIVSKNGISDHNAQIFSYNIESPIQHKIEPKVRIFSKYNYEAFYRHVSGENWNPVYECQNIESAFELFSSTILYYINICFPLKHIKKYNKPNWITRGIKISSEKLKLLYCIKIQSNRQEDDMYYKCYKKIYRKVCRAAKKLHNDGLYHSSTNKSKAAWMIINNNLGKSVSRSSEIQELRVDNDIVSGSDRIANCFNNYFTNTAGHVSVNTLNESFNDLGEVRGISSSIFVTPATESEIFNLIVALKKTNSSGIDQISPNILRSVALFVRKPLTFLVNWSLQEGVFPDVLKIAKVIPLYKKGNKCSIENYRPISLLSCLSKVLERVVFERMASFIDKNDILCSSQHGFREGRSTQTAILAFLNNLYDRINNSDKCFGIFMDLSKAFDLVNHKMLIHKLQRYGFRGKLGDWLSSYLTDRKQLVSLNNNRSDILNVSCGVPQGSVLGPLLFLLFVNDVGVVIDRESLVLFADDTTLLSAHEDILQLTAIAQTSLDRLMNWFNHNKLVVNIGKTVFIHFTPRLSNYDKSYLLRINGNSLEQVRTTKFLGLHLDNALSWECHVNALCKKLASSCYVLYGLSSITSKSVLLSYYYAQFYSRIKYCVIFWGLSQHADRIFKLQKRAIRNITGLRSSSSCRGMFKELKILTLPSIYILELVTYVKSNISEFTTNNFHHDYSTRSGNQLSIPFHSLSLYKRSPRYMGIILYNKLPNNVKIITNLKTFNRSVRIILLNHCFYSVNEFLNHMS